MKRMGGLLFAAVLIVTQAQALEVAGVPVPEKVMVGGQEISLNGAGIRTKFFFDIYVGALYLARRTTDAAQAMTMDGPKRVSMHILYSEVSKEKLVDGWKAGFKKNQPREAMKKLRDRLDRFNAMFTSVKSGDVILLDYVPGQGTKVTIRGEVRGIIPGKDFNEALLAVWLGKRPADKDLKEAMLSGGA
jgi:hypothetical protein